MVSLFVCLFVLFCFVLFCFVFKESCVQGSCKRVKQMMDTWTLQMGYPVLSIKEKGNGKFEVSQERFLYDRDANVTSKYKSDYKWE